jgi:hypothetical protein
MKATWTLHKRHEGFEQGKPVDFGEHLLKNRVMIANRSTHVMTHLTTAPKGTWGCCRVTIM